MTGGVTVGSISVPAHDAYRQIAIVMVTQIALMVMMNRDAVSSGLAC